jgi:hypothetical protein
VKKILGFVLTVAFVFGQSQELQQGTGLGTGLHYPVGAGTSFTFGGSATNKDITVWGSANSQGIGIGVAGNAPTIQFIQDNLNLNIKNWSADKDFILTLRPGGTMTEVLRVKANGNLIGIGDISIPKNKSYNIGSSEVTANRRVLANNSTDLTYLGQIDAGWGNGVIINSGNYFQFNVNNKITSLGAMRIDNTGNVGIGTTTPNSLFHTEKYISNDLIAKIVNTSGAGGGGLSVETTDGNGVGDAFKVVTFRSISPKNMIRVTNHPSTVILAETTGNVGIATDNPKSRLQVGDISGSISNMSLTSATYGSAQMTISNSNSYTEIPSSTPTAKYWGLDIHNDDNTNNNYAIMTFSTKSSKGLSSSYSGIVGASIASQFHDRQVNSDNILADLVFSTRYGGHLRENMRITSTGNVGIGTTNTNGSKLAVNGDKSVFGDSGYVDSYASYAGQNNRGVQLQGKSSGYGISTFSFLKKNESNKYAGIIDFLSDAFSAGDKRLAKISAVLDQDINNEYRHGKLLFQTRSNADVAGEFNTMSLDHNGNVGIGTTNTNGAKLAVNGEIQAKKIKVTLQGWPDYVFADDYELKSLEEIEAYIKEKKHLPGIPSQKEVDEKGLDLGDMQAKMMEKIEELTLHMIELKKQLKIQNSKLRMACVVLK